MKPPIYKTKRFILKPYEKNDLNRFLEIGIDAEVTRFMGESTNDDPKIEQSKHKLFNAIFKIYKNHEKRWFWIWGVYEGKKLVAHFELKQTQHTAEDELEIVYMVHPAERKKGTMSEILSFIKDYQANWKRKIIATVDPENINSISLLTKWGIEKKELIRDIETGEDYFKFWLK